MPCTCKIKRGEKIDEAVIPLKGYRKNKKRDIHKITVELCDACKAYTLKRNALIPRAWKLAQADSTAWTAEGDNEVLNFSFFKHMDKLAKETGLCS